MSKNITCFFLTLLATATFPTHAEQNNAGFDTEMLKQRGLDPSLGQYFATGAVFPPGNNIILIKVNNEPRGNATVRFDDKGQLCLNEDIYQKLNLRRSYSQLVNTKDGCDSLSPTGKEVIHYNPQPADATLAFTVATGEISQEHLYAHGGTGALLNYDFYTTKNRFSGTESNYSQLGLEEGFNIADWLLRSKQILTKNDDEQSTNALYTYAQHTFDQWQKTFQVGEINVSQTLFSGDSISGFQFVPEYGLLPRTGQNNAVVTGIAQTQQARVEVRQSGTLVFSTVVPAGPFTLTDIPITKQNTDLDVTVRETNGAVNQFVIPAASIGGGMISRQEGLSFAVGKLRDIETDYDKPNMATMTNYFNLYPWLNLGIGGQVAEKYASAASEVNLAREFGNFSVLGRTSMDKRGDNNGLSATAAYSTQFRQNIGFSLSGTKYSSGYRSLTDSLDKEFQQYSEQYSTSVSFSQEVLGAFSVGINWSKGRGNTSDASYLIASWGKSYQNFTASLSIQDRVGGKDDDNGINNDDDRLIYARISWRPGKQTYSTYMRKQDSSTALGLQTSGDLGQDSSYSLSVENNDRDDSNNAYASFNTNLHYTSVSMNAGMGSDDQRNYGVNLSGGIVAHRNGVTFSPYPVEDTFGIVSLNEKVPGIRISSSSGTVWTDYWGNAVIPSIQPYQAANVEMDTTTLPKNVDINNGYFTARSAKGSVSNVDFRVLSVRRAMMRLSASDPNYIRKGRSVVDDKGSYIGTIVDDGYVFLNDIDAKPKLHIENEEGKSLCQISYQIADEKNLDSYYENIQGVCQ
ncbi:fimbrial biogenesis usher protein [Citrobacter arsenatis]|uniref:fimbrial biogenesis usher protein n=1 Tax=Citrobacter arsenatis TaxID=2546350 RepID=UPI00300E0673